MNHQFRGPTFEVNPALNESSDSFSSFEFRPATAKQEEFSPYRHPGKSKPPKPQPKPNKPSQKRPQFSNLILRNNVMPKQLTSPDQPAQKQQTRTRQPLQQQKGEEGQNSFNETPRLMSSPHRSEQELSMSHIGRPSQQNRPAATLTQQIVQKYPKVITKHQNFVEGGLSSDSEMSDENSDLNRPKEIKKRKGEKRRREGEEELIAEYSKRQFKDKSIKRAVLEQRRREKGAEAGQKQGEVVERRGGICFELDKGDFRGQSQPQVKSKPTRKKKPVEVNSRQEVIRRRQTARMYDQMARTRLFRCYY